MNPKSDESQQQVQVHHPWMPVQQQPQEQVQEEPQQQFQQQNQGEVPNTLKSIQSRIQGWSIEKKVLIGIAVFALFVMCVNVIRCSVEEDASGESLASSEEAKPTSTPTDEDRNAGKHCVSFRSSAEGMIQFNMRDPISLKWAGLDPSSLKITDYNIAPLDHDLTALFEEAYGDVWPDRKKHAAMMEFTAETNDGGKVRRRAAFWVTNDHCNVVLLDVAGN